jgi:hypothetical protein
VSLNVERASEADRPRNRPALRLGIEDAALGMHRVVNAQMVEGIRRVSIRRGVDPRGFAWSRWVARPIHATTLCRTPSGCAVSSFRAFPACCRPPVYSSHQSSTKSPPAFPRDVDGLDLQEAKSVLAGLDARCGALMASEG